jgi:hypothetical protein
MSVLMPTSLVCVAVLVLAYIAGTELCLPTVRHALHTGDSGPWRLACRLVTAGEWSLLAVCVSLLLTLEQVWQLFSATQGGRLVGLSAAGLLVAVVCWELAGRSRRHQARVMSTSLNLALPASGERRDLYERLHPQLETGSRAEQQQVLQVLFAQSSTDRD